MKNNIKKKSTAVVAIIAVAAILLSGTFAYVLNNQHKSDYLSAEDRIYDLTLINNFTQYGEQDWNNNKTVLNPVQIKSSANTADETYVNAYVAVQLMEYLDVYTRGDWLTVGEVLASTLVGTVGTSFNANNTDQALFAIDDNGDYMTYTAAVAQFGADYIVEYNGFAMFNGSQTLVQGTAIYGIHGKPMRDEKTEYTYGNPTPYEHVQVNGAENQVNAECDATVIEGWGVETPAVEAREYVSFLLDETNAVMLLSDWQAAYAADDTDPALTGAFWIIDDVNGTGWAYWAQALAPGAETSNLLESITLEKEISKIDYYMHVDMASASLDDIDVLADTKANNGCLMPEELIQMFKERKTEPENNESITVQVNRLSVNTMECSAIVNSSALSGDVTWNVADRNGSALNASTQINNATGVLSIQDDDFGKTLIITANSVETGDGDVPLLSGYAVVTPGKIDNEFINEWTEAWDYMDINVESISSISPVQMRFTGIVFSKTLSGAVLWSVAESDGGSLNAATQIDQYGVLTVNDSDLGKSLTVTAVSVEVNGENKPRLSGSISVKADDDMIISLSYPSKMSYGTGTGAIAKVMGGTGSETLTWSATLMDGITPADGITVTWMYDEFDTTVRMVFINDDPSLLGLKFILKAAVTGRPEINTSMVVTVAND